MTGASVLALPMTGAALVCGDGGWGSSCAETAGPVDDPNVGAMPQTGNGALSSGPGARALPLSSASSLEDSIQRVVSMSPAYRSPANSISGTSEPRQRDHRNFGGPR